MLLQLDRVAPCGAAGKSRLALVRRDTPFGMYEKHLGWFIEFKKIRHRTEAHPP
jgi:hypothetical protein